MTVAFTSVSRWAIGAVIAAAVAGLVWPSMAGPASLAEEMQVVAKRWPDIPHLSAQDLSALIGRGEAVLFDVRGSDEYAVSHIASAEQVDPDISLSAFLERYGSAVKGKYAIFYCSVGVRSSKLAALAKGELMRRGALGVDDLAGGIFGWHNEGRPLVDASGSTNFVHPYDSNWGRLLARQTFVRTKPPTE